MSRRRHEYDRIPYLVAYQNNSGCPRRVRRRRRTRGAGELPAPAEGQAVGHRAGVHASDRRRGVPADDQRAGPRRPSRHLLQQPVPRHRLRAADGEGRRGPRRVHQGRQEPARLLQGGAGRLERRRLAVGVLPAAGSAPDGDREPVRRRPRPDQAGSDPRRRHHAARRPHQPARHAHRVARRVHPRRVRSRPSAIPNSTSTTPTTPTSRPTAPEFLARYRQAQIARNRRITKWVKDKLAELEGRRPARRRVRVRRARHDGRPPLAGPDRRPQRTRPRAPAIWATRRW